jgi:hypothetical protein
VYYKCVKFHKNPISGLGGVALTRYMDGRTGWFLYTTQTLFAGGINTVIPPTYMAIPSAMKNWPYKRSPYWGGQFS